MRLMLWRETVGKRLYVGNLSYSTTNDELKDLLGAYGQVESADIIIDRETGRSKGFGFVEMSDESDADAAINALHGTEQGGRTITVNEAKPRAPRGGGGYGGGGGDRW